MTNFSTEQAEAVTESLAALRSSAVELQGLVHPNNAGEAESIQTAITNEIVKISETLGILPEVHEKCIGGGTGGLPPKC